jgi:hypothetical protein
MKKKLDYEVLETVRPSFDSKHDYLLLRVCNTILCYKKSRFQEYILRCNEVYWQKVNDWVNEYVLPYMTNKSINYRFHNDDISTRCEVHLGEDVPHELISYILALNGIPGENRKIEYKYPTLLYYHLSDEFDKATMKAVI